MNKFIGIGRLCQDITIENYGETSVAKFNIAIARKGKKDETDFIPCTAFNKTAENIQKFFAKGNMIAIEGRLQINTYEDKDGKKRTGTQVLVESFSFCGQAKKDGTDQVKNIEVDLTTELENVSDDDLPF